MGIAELLTAAADTLRRRIRSRAHDVSDADLSVLEHQLATVKPLHDNEMDRVISIDTEQPFDVEQVQKQIKRLAGAGA